MIPARLTSYAPATLAALMFALCALLGGAKAYGQQMLQGPHPFNHQNALSINAGMGLAAADGVDGIRAQVAYGYQLSGSLWLALQVAMVDGFSDGSASGTPCGSCGTDAETLAGLSYRLRMNVPVVPYGSILLGTTYAFPQGAGAAMGLKGRSALGARYYIFDNLGFGAELGSNLGFVAHGELNGLDNLVFGFDFTVGVEFQF